MDRLRNIGAQMSSLTQNLPPMKVDMGSVTKGLSSGFQATKERLGAVDTADLTELPQEYLDLEANVDKLARCHHSVLKVAKIYDHESYDYSNLTESISDTATGAFHGLHSFAASSLKSTPVGGVLSPSSTSFSGGPKTLPHALSRATSSASMGMYPSPLKDGLAAYSLAIEQVGAARLLQDQAIQEEFTTPWTATLNSGLNLATKARQNVRQARLWLDGCKQSLKTASPAKQEQAKLEVERAEDALVAATESAIQLMKNVLDSPEPIKNLLALAKAQAVFHAAAAQDLTAVTSTLEMKVNEAETGKGRSS